jgi:hypothetical protein
MRSLAIVLALSLTACSFIQIPRVDENVPAPCNRSKRPVKIDLAVGTAAIVLGLALLLFIEPREQSEGRNIPGTVTGGAGVLTGIGFFVSAKLGSERAEECRQMQTSDPRYGVSDD